MADTALMEGTVSTAPVAEAEGSSEDVEETVEAVDHLWQEAVPAVDMELEEVVEVMAHSPEAEVVEDSEPPRSQPTEAPTDIRSTGSTSPTGGTEPPERSASATSAIERKT